MSKWIPVEDKLPEVDDLVLCWNDRLCEIEMCRFVRTDAYGAVWEEQRDLTTVGSEMISHWMHLPASPE